MTRNNNAGIKTTAISQDRNCCSLQSKSVQPIPQSMQSQPMSCLCGHNSATLGQIVPKALGSAGAASIMDVRHWTLPYSLSCVSVVVIRFLFVRIKVLHPPWRQLLLLRRRLLLLLLAKPWLVGVRGFLPHCCLRVAVHVVSPPTGWVHHWFPQSLSAPAPFQRVHNCLVRASRCPADAAFDQVELYGRA